MATSFDSDGSSHGPLDDMNLIEELFYKDALLHKPLSPERTSPTPSEEQAMWRSSRTRRAPKSGQPATQTSSRGEAQVQQAKKKKKKKKKEEEERQKKEERRKNKNKNKDKKNMKEQKERKLVVLFLFSNVLATFIIIVFLLFFLIFFKRAPAVPLDGLRLRLSHLALELEDVEDGVGEVLVQYQLALSEEAMPAATRLQAVASSTARAGVMRFEGAGAQHTFALAEAMPLAKLSFQCFRRLAAAERPELLGVGSVPLSSLQHAQASFTVNVPLLSPWEEPPQQVAVLSVDVDLLGPGRPTLDAAGAVDNEADDPDAPAVQMLLRCTWLCDVPDRPVGTRSMYVVCRTLTASAQSRSDVRWHNANPNFAHQHSVPLRLTPRTLRQFKENMAVVEIWDHAPAAPTSTLPAQVHTPFLFVYLEKQQNRGPKKIEERLRGKTF